jgi:hypothetical protein
MSNEIWKPIHNYEGLYEISSHGNVKSFGRYRTHCRGGKRFCKGRILKPINNHGYLYVQLVKNEKIVRYAIHRLVLFAFSPTDVGNLQVNHKNAIKSDNRLENLEWTTSLENIHHSLKMGLVNRKGEKNAGAKLTIYQARDIRENFKRKVYGQAEIFSKKYNISKDAVRAIAYLRSWDCLNT